MDILNTDAIRSEGIYAKGFGIIPKAVMLDPDLTAEAKAIYAYFCSYAGAGETAFPGWQKIVSDLHVNKDSYYKHYKLLISEGYISVTQENAGGKGQGFCRNIYTLISVPQKYTTASIPKGEGSLLLHTGIKSLGYGIISKLIMTSDISIRAKALYAYLCSYAGASGCACPGKELAAFHLHVSKNSLTSYFKELTSAGYIISKQRRVGGRLGVCDYYIAETTDDGISLQPKFSESQTPRTKISESQNSDTQKQETKFSETQISEANNNNLKSNSLKNNSPENHHQGGGVKEYLFKNCALPERKLSHSEAFDAMYLLLQGDRHLNKSAYDSFDDGKIKYTAAKLFFDAAVSLLTHEKGYKISGELIDSKTFTAMLNDYIVRLKDGTVILDIIPGEAEDAYLRALEKDPIVSPVAYMRTCIISAVKNADMFEEG